MKKILLALALLISYVSKAQVSTDTGSLRTQINTKIIQNGNKQITAQQLNDILNGTLNLIPQYPSLAQAADYVIHKVGAVYYATPKAGSGLLPYVNADAYTVIQSAINALTPSGQCNSCGGGKIVLMDTAYSLSNELVITGWTTGNVLYGSGQSSQLVIEGKSSSTQITQNTSSKNALKIINGASVVLKNFFFNIGHDAYSAVFMDSTGANTKMSCYNCLLDNITVVSNSVNSPGMFLRNFYFSQFPYLNITTYSHTALELQNASTTTNYGNSVFGNLILNGNTGIPYAGLKIRTNNPNPSTTTATLDHLVFQNVQVFAGYYGIYADNSAYCHFDKVDLEFAITRPIYFGAANGASLGNTIMSGFIQSNQTVYTAIGIGAHSFRNTFNDLTITGSSASIVPIADSSTGLEANTYRNLSFDGNDYSPNISVTSAANTYISYKTVSGVTNYIMGGLIKSAVFKSATSNGAITSGAYFYNGGGGDGTGSSIGLGYATGASNTAHFLGYYDNALTSLDAGVEDNSGNRMATWRNGSSGIGNITTPTARLHLPAGSTSAGSAPLKINVGSLMTGAESGAIENDGGHAYYTTSTPTRFLLPNMISGGATLDFPSTSSTTVSDLTITLIGAVLGDMVILGVPNGSQTTTGSFTAWVSASNTVKVRFSPKATEDPASGVFTVAIIR